ncbi:MAG: deoxyribodipyrimidine photo-lyase [Bacteroidia bacterium]|jgi:deoxyribodipyrimidine photo-lyase
MHKMHIQEEQAPIAVFWFRRDLRLEDNVGLNTALDAGLPVLPIFIFDTNILNELDESDARVSFIYDQLVRLKSELMKRGGALLTFHGRPIEVLKKALSNYSVKQVYTNQDYEPYGIKRDAEIRTLLNQQKVEFHSLKDSVIHDKHNVVKADGKPYTVFTPYKNKWFESVDLSAILPVTNISDNWFTTKTYIPSLEEIGFKRSEIEVRPFNLKSLNNYEQSRDIPSQENTSDLGPHLRFGTVGVRTIINQIKQHPVFLSELIWREFFMQILFHFPDVVTHNFRRKYDGVQWENDENNFERWCNGETGYPMVDAGMRQLNQTGYMHNRVRMVTASFLCKHLLIDWRWGEAYFARKLLDYELSSNNGNWQWSAGTGCDAAPYFRIFNPSEQLRKFDPNEVYVKRWISELGSQDYPKPIIEHKFARLRALERYKEGILLG